MMENNSRSKELTWQTLEYEEKERSSDWFWLVGLVAVLGIIVSVVTLNFLFAVVILISAFSVMMYAVRKPEIITITIGRRGVMVKKQFYPYRNISAFAIRDDEFPHHLILHINRLFLPHITVDLKDMSPDLVRTYLEEFLPEEPYEEHLLDLMANRLGF